MSQYQWDLLLAVIILLKEIFDNFLRLYFYID